MKKPWYQKTFTAYIPWILSGFLFVGSLLDTISNSIDLITPAITYWGTGLALLIFFVGIFLVRRYPVQWLTEDNQIIRIKSIGVAPFLTLIGVLFALWLPKFSDIYKENNPTSSDIEQLTSSINEPATTKDFFPEFMGYGWTYNLSSSSGALQNDSFDNGFSQMTKRVATVETGLGDRLRIIGVEQYGEGGYLNKCPVDVSSGNSYIWHVVDETRFYTACSKDEAYQIAMDLRNEIEHGTTARLKTPDYVLPFEVGNLWAWDLSLPPREDTNYQWFVEAQVDVVVPAGKFEDCFRILLYTLNSSTIQWICPDVGLVAAEYHHHGAPDEFRAELASFGLNLEE